jgi:lysophospholipase L1-like esterase
LRWPAIGLIACVAILEILLRLLGFARPKMSQLDALLGWRQRPGVVADYVREGAGHVSFNAVGFRDVDHARVKPPDTYRIAVFGDSMVEAREVQLEETFWKRLESLLSGHAAVSGKRVEVLNFAVNGYGTAQSYLALRDCALDYRPDLVLLGFVTNTDIEENSAKLNSHRFRPYFAMIDGHLRQTYSPGDDPIFMQRLYRESVRLNFLDRLRSYQLAREIKVAVRSQLRRPRRARRRPEAALGISAGIYPAPQRKEWQDAWAITERLLLEIDRASRESGAEFVLAILPNPIQVTADSAAQQRVCRGLGVTDLRYPDRRLDSFARARGIRCIPLVDMFAQHIHNHGEDVYFANPGSPLLHFTKVGHELVAQHLAAELAAQRAGMPAPD